LRGGGMKMMRNLRGSERIQRKPSGGRERMI